MQNLIINFYPHLKIQTNYKKIDIKVIVENDEEIKLSDLKRNIINSIFFEWNKKLWKEVILQKEFNWILFIFSLVLFGISGIFLAIWHIMVAYGIKYNSVYFNYFYISILFLILGFIVILIIFFSYLRNLFKKIKTLKISSKFIDVEMKLKDDIEENKNRKNYKSDDWFIVLFIHLTKLKLPSNGVVRFLFYIKNKNNKKIINDYMKFYKWVFKKFYFKIESKVLMK